MAGGQSPNSHRERDVASDLRQRTLSQIPSLFGRLVYLASLRDPTTGCYQHLGMVETFGESEIDRALREAHAAAFADWLCLDLEQQKADLEHYLSSVAADERTVIENWLRVAPYRNLVPATAQDQERELYVADMMTLVDLLGNEWGVGLREAGD